MPKIQADTVAAHREAKEREILDAASKFFAVGELATIATLADAVGLSRTALYKYFGSIDEIRWRIIEDSFAEWGEIVASRVAEASTPEGKIDAYVEATLALADRGVHRIATQAGQTAQSPEHDERIATFMERLGLPLVAALLELEVNHATIVGTLIDGILGRAIQLIDAGRDVEVITETTLELVRRATIAQEKE